MPKRSQSKVRRKRPALRRVTVRARPAARSRGWLAAGPWRLPVALGRGGIKAAKREGDGATPRGTFRPLRLWWHPGRSNQPGTLLPLRRIGPHDAWCEDPADGRYNRPIRLRGNAPGDRLWRQDHLYDLILEIDHNARPRVAGLGSAVFIHLARPDFGPTAGCVALRGPALRRLLARIDRNTRIVIQ